MPSCGLRPRKSDFGHGVKQIAIFLRLAYEPSRSSSSRQTRRSPIGSSSFPNRGLYTTNQVSLPGGSLFDFGSYTSHVLKRTSLSGYVITSSLTIRPSIGNLLPPSDNISPSSSDAPPSQAAKLQLRNKRHRFG
ncbi:hypothetical protein NLU13_4140 [Sarocladium strictum]|uniref:Uncharacterized protein n=1 Tax=Sarocladium strictum TaxID=5046 RepID=A0AA39GIB1_SARSR|nr:hypothetical protein NLU13_4140 [Sarocladium strictum]